MQGLTIAEYFGVSPGVMDTTAVGGSSYEFHAAHAAADIAAGKADVALLTYGSTGHSDRRAAQAALRSGDSNDKGKLAARAASRVAGAAGPIRSLPGTWSSRTA